jgi:hypothetical protein
LDREHHDMNETRETANADVDQAISRSVEDSASGRAEDSMLFHKNLHKVQHFCEKEKTHHAAAGDSAVHRVKRPV